MLLSGNHKTATIAIVPFIGARQSEESQWFGALFSSLLADHLIGAGLPVYPYNAVASQISDSKIQIPLNEEGVQTLKQALKLEWLIQGRYVLDEDSKMMGLRMLVESTASPRVPLEVSAPLSGFGRFIESICLALIEQLNVTVTDAIRSKVAAVARPASFEAFRQFSMAVMDWSKGQNQLALTAVTSALALDPDLEDAAAIQVAIARSANDAGTVREAFRRWSGIAAKRKRPKLAAERLMMLGHWLIERGEWPEAHRAYEDARNLLGDDEHGKALVGGNLANLDMLSGKLQAAIQAYRRNLRVFDGSPTGEEDAAITYFNLGVSHKSLGQPEEAEKALEEALVLARRLKNTFLEACCLAQRGALRDDTGQWGLAAKDYEQAARLFDIVGDDKNLAMLKSHQAILKKQQGIYDQAETLMLDALSIFEKSGDPHEQAVVWLNLADLYYSMGLFESALEYAGKAEDVFSRLKSGWASRARQFVKLLQTIPRAPSAPDAAPPVASADLLAQSDALDQIKIPAGPSEAASPSASPSNNLFETDLDRDESSEQADEA